METDVTDLEMTKLCAEAMGFDMVIEQGAVLWNGDMPQWYAQKVGRQPQDVESWAPLHDDAQAMALVKRFRPNISGGGDTWSAYIDRKLQSFGARHADLNRAIVECVAKMRAADAQHSAGPTDNAISE
jgi:hypothetical protein